MKRNNVIKEINYELVPEKISEKSTIFINKADTFSYTKYEYDVENELKKISNKNRADSLVKTIIKEGEFNIKYYYKDSKDVIYKIGQEFNYKNNRISLYIRYDEIWGKEYIQDEIEFIYSEKGILIMEINNYHGGKTFYSYNTLGLVSEIDYIGNKTITYSIFNYWFSEHEYDPRNN